jgi:hypothetical protein
LGNVHVHQHCLRVGKIELRLLQRCPPNGAEKLGHICIQAAAISDRRFGVSALAGDLTTIAFSRDGRQAIYNETVPDVPCNAWQLASST